MKRLKIEKIALVIAGGFLLFCGGWFLGRGGGSDTYTVATQRNEPPPPIPTQQVFIQDKRVNINTADAAALQSLPGIGATRAADIIAYRTQHGAFRYVEELTEVSGIGENTLVGLKDFVTVEE